MWGGCWRVLGGEGKSGRQKSGRQNATGTEGHASHVVLSMCDTPDVGVGVGGYERK